MRGYLLGLATAYVVVALATGAVASKAMPALNLLGATYVGATWPGSMFCAATFDCSVLPPQSVANNFFTFEEHPTND